MNSVYGSPKMELSELKARWQETERRLEDVHAELRVGRRVAEAAARGEAQSKLGVVRALLWGQLQFGVLAAFAVGAYLAGNLATPKFAIPAVVLHLGTIWLIVSAARQLRLLSTIDFAGPVVDTQRRLARLLRMRSRTNQWVMFGSPALWALLVIVVPHGLAGFDVYATFGVPWVAANLAFGVVVVVAFAWAARRYPSWYADSLLLRSLGDDLVGRRVAAASGFLAELDAFEGEPART